METEYMYYLILHLTSGDIEYFCSKDIGVLISLAKTVSIRTGEEGDWIISNEPKEKTLEEYLKIEVGTKPKTTGAIN